MPFSAFWDHSQWKIVEFLTSSGSWGQLVPITSVHYRGQSYRRIMLGYQTGKNGWEATEKRQRIVLKKDWCNKENIIFLWLGRVSNRENINKRKRRPENICRKREVSGQNEKFGIPALFQASSAPSHRPGKEAELFTLDKQHREFLNGRQGSLHLRNRKHR